MKMKANEIKKEDINGFMSTVKYVETSGEEDFIVWLNVLREDGYMILRYDEECCILHNLMDETDVVKLKCAVPIKENWLREHFPDYFRIYQSK